MGKAYLGLVPIWHQSIYFKIIATFCLFFTSLYMRGYNVFIKSEREARYEQFNTPGGY